MKASYFLILAILLFSSCALFKDDGGPVESWGVLQKETIDVIEPETATVYIKPDVKGSSSFTKYGITDGTLIPYNTIKSLELRIPHVDDSVRLKTIIIQPGFFAQTTRLDDISNWLASHGFLVVGLNNEEHFDIITTNLDHYEEAIIDALHYVYNNCTNENSQLYQKVDTTGIAFCGHSMGGGGMIRALQSGDTLVDRLVSCALAMNPYGNTDGTNIDIPIMFIASEIDSVFNPLMPGTSSAPSAIFSTYHSVPKTGQKIFGLWKGQDHNAVCDFNIFLKTSGNFSCFSTSITSWFKVQLAEDERYRAYLVEESEEFKTIEQLFTEKGTLPAYEVYGI